MGILGKLYFKRAHIKSVPLELRYTLPNRSEIIHRINLTLINYIVPRFFLINRVYCTRKLNYTPLITDVIICALSERCPIAPRKTGKFTYLLARRAETETAL